ncbi:uncharacterized protein BJ171DRAFT_499572 [Polychytrium aggregatum]|uniref:uncharacterized protein n=1 Tax=Polychytrium aggregatum TaxID=110093 RepID=UPI0022FE4676|nr:uncharacterized protein BJ171DRAFT_499572 [Polychytrium aggregatum]KAI9205772.1 hypothetical protein BJ171DRAFT_499572 [Polychytrium aggregatum]
MRPSLVPIVGMSVSILFFMHRSLHANVLSIPALAGNGRYCQVFLPTPHSSVAKAASVSVSGFLPADTRWP